MSSDAQEQLASRFVCAKCKNRGGTSSRLAATGTGFSRLFDIQHQRFAVISCTNCGYTEMYNLKVLGERGRLANVLDVIFGGS